ncbi:MAG: radical SAM protein [Candidatus Heimdallarchaeaceae archaeon]
MDKEKIEEVGKLTDVKANDMTKQKIRKKITLAYYSIIQLAFLAISSLVSSLFGFSKRTSGFYPYVTFDPNYIFGPIIVAIVQGGNFALSYRLRKTGRLVVRKGTDTVLSPFYTYTIVFLNFILSVVGLSMYKLDCAIWELTLACNMRCKHCGSSAGTARVNELSLEEAYKLCKELANEGCDLVTLMGGEPFVREDWKEISWCIRDLGMKLGYVTNGLLVPRVVSTQSY